MRFIFPASLAAMLIVLLPCWAAPAGTDDVAAHLPRRFAGWMLWHCWNESQSIAVEFENVRARDGRIEASGYEFYQTTRSAKRIDVVARLDPDAGTFELWEVDRPTLSGDPAGHPAGHPGGHPAGHPAERDSHVVGGPYTATISRDLRRIRTPMTDHDEGCEPDILLVAEDPAN